MKPTTPIGLLIVAGSLATATYAVATPQVKTVVHVKTVKQFVPKEVTKIQYVDSSTKKEVVPPTADLPALTGGVHVIKDWSLRAPKDSNNYDYGWKVFSVYGRTCFAYRPFGSIKGGDSVWCEDGVAK